jgi:hypothetical protein
VFVASPKDVAEERACLEDVVREINLTWSKNLGIRLELIKWETHAFPGVGTDPQAVINEQIGNDYDIFIGIIWTRFGTPTERADSGTAEEFNRAYKRFRENPDQLRIMFYFKDAPIAPSELDPDQLALIREFREQLGEKGTLYWSYTTREEFATFIRMHLSRQVQEWQKSWGRGKGSSPTVRGDNVPLITTSQVTHSVQEEEEGLLDLIEVGKENFKTLIEAMYRIKSAIEIHKKQISDRAEKLKEAKATEQRKRAINRVAEDMDQFVAHMEAEIPIFSKAYLTGVDAFARAVVLWNEDFRSVDKQRMKSALMTVQKSKSNLGNLQDKITSLRDTIAKIPRLTTVLNQAKGRMLSVLDKFNEQMAAALNLTSEAGKVLEKIIAY